MMASPAPIVKRIQQLKNELDQLEVIFHMEYFNTSSTKCLFDVLMAVKRLGVPENNLIIDWIHEEDDTDMVEIGEDFEELSELSFRFTSLSEEEFEASLAY